MSRDSPAIGFLPPMQELNTSERHICLTRDVQASLSLSMETAVSKVMGFTKSIAVFGSCSSGVLWFPPNNLSLGFLFQVKVPLVNAKSRVLVPGLPGHQAPVKGTSQGSEKRKKDSDTKEVCKVLMLMIALTASFFRCDDTVSVFFPVV